MDGIVGAHGMRLLVLARSVNVALGLSGGSPLDGVVFTPALHFSLVGTYSGFFFSS